MANKVYILRFSQLYNLKAVQNDESNLNRLTYSVYYAKIYLKAL